MNEQQVIRTPFGNSYIMEKPPTLRRVVMQPVELHWTCPMPDCGGDMHYTQYVWPAGENPAYHHKCDKCGKVAAVIFQKFPRVEYEPVP